MITLYDLGPTTIPADVANSPHVRKVIFVLNYKSIPFQVRVLHPYAIEETARSLGITTPMERNHRDGSPKFTVPFLHDSSTGKVVIESLRIAEYLDEAYPTTPGVFPANTRTLQSVFADVITMKSYDLMPVVIPDMMKLYSKEYTETRVKIYPEVFGALPSLSNEQKRVLWNKAKASVDDLARHYAGGTFVMGDTPSFADFVVASMYLAVRVAFGEGSEEWKNVRGWGDGLIGRAADFALGLKSCYVEQTAS